MQTFKKTAIAVVCLLCCVILMSVVVIEPVIYKEHNAYADAGLRKSLAGELDFVFIGDSDGMTAFRPKLFNEQTEKNSYNLSGTMMTTGGMKYLLEKELERNPVETVVLQVSHEMICRDMTDELGDGDSVIVQRLDSVWERFDYMFRHVGFNDWLNVYSRLLVTGLVDWKDTITGNSADAFVDEELGWHKVRNNDLRLTEQEAITQHNTKHLGGEYYDHYTEEFHDLVQMVKNYDVEIVMVILPVANYYLWTADGWDEFRVWSEEFCENEGISLIDFNLYKERFDLFFDETSYKDYAHMSEAGADALTACMAELFENREDPAFEELFYDSYQEMKEDSPYRQKN